MRQILLLFSVILLVTMPVYAQNTVDQDAVLKNIRTQLPEGWTAEAKDKKIVFSRTDSVWTRKINPNPGPNAKKLNKEERIASFKKEGRKAKTMLSYRLDLKWSADAIKKAEDQNRKTFHQISKLPAKFKIEALFDSVRSEKGGDYYTGKTPADKEQIKKFEDERNRLLKSVVQVPFLQSEKYSLYPDSSSGYEDATTDIYPEQASFEWFKVQSIVTDLCKLKTH